MYTTKLILFIQVLPALHIARNRLKLVSRYFEVLLFCQFEANEKKSFDRLKKVISSRRCILLHTLPITTMISSS